MIAIVLSSLSYDIAHCFVAVSFLQTETIETESSLMAGLAEADLDPKIDTDSKNKAVVTNVCARLAFCDARAMLLLLIDLVVLFLFSPLTATILSPLEAAIAAMMSPLYGSPSEADDLVEQSPSQSEVD